MKKEKSVSKLVIDYMRRCMVGNEQQGLATFYGYMTSHLPDYRDLVDIILTGTQSSGKTMLQKAIRRGLPTQMTAEYSGGSPKAFIYDEELQDAQYYFFSELQKFSPEWIEFLKSLSGDDPEFVYKVTVKTSYGFTTQKITLKKTPFSITSAREMKDPELRSRLMQVPMDESKKLNEAILRWQLGDTEIEYNGFTYTQNEDNEHRDELREIVRAIYDLKLTEETPNIVIPKRFIDTISTMIDFRRTNSRRHAKLVAILLKISRLLDFVYCEMNPVTPVPETLECGAQDMLNLLTLQPILLTTITELDERAKAIYEIVDKYPHCTRQDIHKHLMATTTSQLNIGKLGSICEEMGELGMLQIMKDKGQYHYSTTGTMQLFGMKTNIDDLLEVDGSPVVDPMTGVEYDNIKLALEDISEKNREELLIMRTQRDLGEY